MGVGVSQHSEILRTHREMVDLLGAEWRAGPTFNGLKPPWQMYGMTWFFQPVTPRGIVNPSMAEGVMRTQVIPRWGLR